FWSYLIRNMLWIQLRKNGFLVGKRKVLKTKRIPIYGSGFLKFIASIKLILNGSKVTIIIHKTNAVTNLPLWHRFNPISRLMCITKIIDSRRCFYEQT